MTEQIGLERRAAVHAALAEPTRLRIVDMLQWGDLTPASMQRELGISSNLLAHHLGQLAEAGVIARHRSEGDRRRTYVRLLRESLDALVPSAPVPMTKIVFVCTGNSARSQLAAALWGQASDVPAASAGTHPAPAVAPGAIAVAERNGLSLASAKPRSFADTVRGGEFIITVCDSAREELFDASGLHWSIADPVPVGTRRAFDSAFADIAARVELLSSHLA